ncbi:MAG: 50S ribosomal protein L28 [Erysipelotrichales bacterium]|nr:50S ribosomal protein L28 [Erysipelotrichales bacterium]MBQ1387164.1 50S ribosomal protein L28 [Erysipelotrichales bacterium]MBQ2309171.1 50S ribosomal protein L28 [Erysipelotrichales bacterium]MBQ2479160.1 50S ribosomal protein L28 [Erysipelotrichales bacterium]MBQ4375707.1 50S ribosomal protein L28 [Erysipelotrichales bacterium]
MPRTCAVTGKKTISGNKRSHSLRATRRKWSPNLHKVKVTDENGHTMKVLMSARGLRTLKAQMAKQ